MKASILLRDDRSPLVRAKLPLTALGLPFLSAFSAGEPRDLRVDLRTAFLAGPVVRLSYRPNDARSPISLAIKIGAGDRGSPAAAPMTMCVEFLPFARGVGGGPFFSVIFKPRLGDFSLKTTAQSASSTPIQLGNLGPASPENGIHDNRKVNGFAPVIAPDGSARGLFSGTELLASSALPLHGGTTVRFRWGLTMPEEVRAALVAGPVEEHRISFPRLPQLVTSKIKIEHTAEASKIMEQKSKPAAEEAAETWLSMKKQVEVLRAEHADLTRDLRELCAEVFNKRMVVPASSGSDVWDGRSTERGSKVDYRQPSVESKDQRIEAKMPSPGAKARAEDVSEELKKALMAATAGK